MCKIQLISCESKTHVKKEMLDVIKKTITKWYENNNHTQKSDRLKDVRLKLNSIDGILQINNKTSVLSLTEINSLKEMRLKLKIDETACEKSLTDCAKKDHIFFTIGGIQLENIMSFILKGDSKSIINYLNVYLNERDLLTEISQHFNLDIKVLSVNSDKNICIRVYEKGFNADYVVGDSDFISHLKSFN